MTQVKMTLRPTPKQDECYQLLFDKKTNYILFGSSGGSGKSWIGTEWILFMSLNFPGTRWALCRAHLKELRSTTVITMFKVLQHHNISPDSIFTYNQVDGFFKFFNGSRIDLMALAYEPSDPLFSRYGSVELSGAYIDEANGVPGEAINVLKSRIGRCMNDHYNLFPKILIGSNPAKGFLYHEFYVRWKEKTLPNNMAFVRALPGDNTYLDKNSMVAMESLTGTIRQRILLGMWEFDQENPGIIEYDAILDSFSGAVEASVKKTGMYYMTVDPARLGNDSAVVTLWDGLRMEKVWVFQKLVLTQLVERIKEIQKQYRVSASQIAIDSVALGAGVLDMIPGAKQFIANAKPFETGNKKVLCANLKTQASFRLAELMNDRKVFINVGAEDYDLKQRIIQELEVIRVKDNLTDSALNIIPKSEVKEEIGHSPDIADAIVMRMLFELRPTPQPYAQFSITRDVIERRAENNERRYKF